MTETLVLTRSIRAPIDRVYAAWTDPTLMARWFFVGEDWKARVTADVRVGGRFRIEMENADGEALVSTGSYLVLDEPRRIRMTWTSYAVRDTALTIDLEPDGEGTLLTLTHSGLPSLDEAERHANGWRGVLDNLGHLLTP